MKSENMIESITVSNEHWDSISSQSSATAQVNQLKESHRWPFAMTIYS